MKTIEIAVPSPVRWQLTRELEKWSLVCGDAAALFPLTGFVGVLLSRLHVGVYGSADLWNTLPTHNSLRYTLLLVLLGAFWLRGHYSKRQPFWNETREIFQISFTIALLHGALILLGQLPYFRSLYLLTWFFTPFALLTMRYCVKKTLVRLGGWTRPMVIIGGGGNALETARAFADEPLMGYRLIALLAPDGEDPAELSYADRTGKKIFAASLGADPFKTLAKLGNPHVVFALEQGGTDNYQAIVQRIGRSYSDLQVVPSLRGLPLYGMEVDHFFSHELLLLSVRNNLARRGPQFFKRCFDILAAAAILTMGFPIFLAIGLCVAASRGPVFYGHKRIGQNGKTFACYKFRTMQPNAAELLKALLERDPQAKAEWERDFKLKNDPRITRIGYFLRRTSLDELPQIWNVLKGDMSLVGPRPVVDAELERYGDQVSYYLEAKPGITGLWQVSGRNDISYDSRVYLDSWYVKNWSFFSDIVILIRTIKVVFGKNGAY